MKVLLQLHPNPSKTTKEMTEIKKGDKFLCTKDYVMDDQTIAYYEGKEYLSEYDNCLTDEGGDDYHFMGQDDPFFDEHFKLLPA